jgi:DNA polymerase II small subunit
MVREILKLCMSKGFLVDKEMMEILSGLNEEGLKEIINAISSMGFNERVITKKLFDENFKKISSLLIEEKGKDDLWSFFKGLGYKKEENEPKEELKSEENSLFLKEGKVKIISAPAFPQKKIEVRDFIAHFRSRYESIRKILEQKGFENLSSIRKISTSRGSYTIIVAVLEKRVTKNKNLLIEVEDLTGKITVLVNQNKKELFEKAKELLQDDIVAFDVTGTNEILFANDITYPDAALLEKRYGDLDESVAFISDIHAGSKLFLEKNLLKFIKWLNGEEGDEFQRKMAKKVKYLFVVGDNVDGVNRYPGQEPFLLEKTSIEQYRKLEGILRLVREDVKIIMCPGQHDTVVWVGEPQPVISDRWAPGLTKMKNLYLVPNPSLVEIDGGFKILMYHGASITNIIEEIPEIRLNYGHRSPTRVVKELLKRRHLSPIHGLADYIPCEKGDSLVIETLPDIVATGDQHRSEVGNYNNILLIASSCWQSITPFEEKVGNVPDPCKVPIFNLKTREIKILDFSDVESKVEEKEVIVAPLEVKDAKIS